MRNLILFKSQLEFNIKVIYFSIGLMIRKKKKSSQKLVLFYWFAIGEMISCVPDDFEFRGRKKSAV